jgi:hypothetical protein
MFIVDLRAYDNNNDIERFCPNPFQYSVRFFLEPVRVWLKEGMSPNFNIRSLPKLSFQALIFFFRPFWFGVISLIVVRII